MIQKNDTKIMKTVLLLLVFFLSLDGFATDYYLSSSKGSDASNGTSPNTAWATLDRINQQSLVPGDRILFKSGDIFEGTLQIGDQGSNDKPILIGKYAEGNLPILDGAGNEASVFLNNPAHIIIENLEITNWKGIYGIRFLAENAGEMSNFTMRDLLIHNVGSNSFTITEPSKTIGGISGRVLKGDKPSWWNGLNIINVSIRNVGSCGITFGNQDNLYKLEKDDPRYKPHLNVQLENVRIDSTARDGIWIRQCDGALIQNCEVSHTGLNAISNGIWFWDCLNSVMQYNEGYECLSPRGNDGAPFSIDNHCYNCVIQYNYSHDNEGPGYMIFGRMGDNDGNIIRHNLSYNDNVTKTYKYGTASIAIVSEVKGALVENNIVMAGQETHNILGHRNWEGFPHSVTYKNNLFIGNGKAVISELEEVMKAGDFQNNIFINVPNIPDELSKQGDFKNYFQQLEKKDELIKKVGLDNKNQINESGIQK